MLFKEFYIKYAAQTLIQEGVMDQVPRKLLKADSDMNKLPDQTPYGFWVDRSGNFRQVSVYGHEEAAEEMLNTAMKYLEKKGVEYSYRSVYSEMYKQGWVRVMLSSSYVYYQTGSKEQPASTHQLRFLNFLGDLYEKPVKKDDF